MRSEDAALNKITHRRTAWTVENGDPTSNLGQARARSLDDIKKKGIMLGRSLYWGLLLYVGAITGGFWLTIVIQSAIVVFVLYLALRAFKYPIWPTLVWLCLGMAFLSDVAFFASYLMPDIFAGFAILACAVLISTRERMTKMEYVLWYLLLAAAALSHDTCVLIAVTMLGLATLADLFRRSWLNWRGLCIILLAVLSAIVGQSIMTYGITRATGEVPLRFPLIEARLIADGPGTDYLRADCPQSQFALCDYVGEFPMSSNDFLFGKEPGKTVYELASYDQRRELSAEQFRFLLAVLKYDPAGVVKSTLYDSGEQFLDFRLYDFQYNADTKLSMDQTFPLQVLDQIHNGAAYKGTMHAGALTALEYIFVVASVVYLLLVLFGALVGRRMNQFMRGIFFWVFAGVVINAAIGGGISASQSRYQSRVVWLIPLVALLVELQAWIRRPENRQPNVV
jgi:hypothetical protein